MQDWTGNEKTATATVGGATGKRAHEDFYATEPKAVDLLCEVENFDKHIWECACGNGIMSDALTRNGYTVRSSDIIDRGYAGTEKLDFLACSGKWHGDIITNPPYRYALDFIKKALSLIDNGHKAAMFLRLQFLETKGRKAFFLANPPAKVYVASGRLHCGRNGNFDMQHGNAIAFAWFVWQKGYNAKPAIDWIN